VFKDTRTIASQVLKMLGQIVKGETVDVNDTSTYDNGVRVVPSYLCEPVFADANNYKTILIDSGYYTEDDLK
jgi:putative multiple sugar transport system substrate-binding protein